MKKRIRLRSISKNKSVLKKKSIPKPKPISSWYANASPRDRLYRQRVLQSGLKLVRRLYAGFTPADGFDGRDLKHLPDAQATELLGYISAANRLTSGEFHGLYQVTRPRTPAQMRAMRVYTSQASPDEDRHPQKGFVTYANTRTARVRFVTEERLVAAPMGRAVTQVTTRVEMRQPVKGGALVHRDYLFREVFGFQPGEDSATPEGLRLGRQLGTFVPWEQMVIAMQRLVKVIPDRTRKGDEAHYRLLSDRGPIGSGVPKHMLVDTMQRWGDVYDETFVEVLIGVRYIGDEFAMRRQGVQSSQRRMRYQRLAHDLRLARRRIRPDGSLRAKSSRTRPVILPDGSLEYPKKKRSAKKKRSIKKKQSRSRKPTRKPARKPLRKPARKK